LRRESSKCLKPERGCAAASWPPGDPGRAPRTAEYSLPKRMLRTRRKRPKAKGSCLVCPRSHVCVCVCVECVCCACIVCGGG